MHKIGPSFGGPTASTTYLLFSCASVFALDETQHPMSRWQTADFPATRYINRNIEGNLAATVGAVSARVQTYEWFSIRANGRSVDVSSRIDEME